MIFYQVWYIINHIAKIEIANTTQQSEYRREELDNSRNQHHVNKKNILFSIQLLLVKTENSIKC